jgi:hypothetical protein
MKFRGAISVFWVMLVLNLAARSQSSPASVKSGPIKSIKVEQNVLTLPCPQGAKQCGCFPSSNLLVNVELEVVKPDKRVRYTFSVTAGRIIGEGPKVVWDLRNTPPGSYSIHAQAVRKGKMLPGTKGETINIVGNINSCDCFDCPILEINATKRSIAAGDTVSVSAIMNRRTQDDPMTLNWTVSVGEIISGQGTSAILIKVPAEIKTNKLVVTLNIGGLRGACSHCATSSSETINLIPLN